MSRQQYLYPGGYGAGRPFFGFTRRYPKQLHTPIPVTYIDPRTRAPGQITVSNVQVNEMNNPIPSLDHAQAVRSAGTVYRMPTLGEFSKAWDDNMIDDSRVIRRAPDNTLMAGATAAGVFPDQLPALYWVPYNTNDQLGFGRVSY